jgi:hypothetical protein
MMSITTLPIDSEFQEQIIRAEVRETSTPVGSRVRLRCIVASNMRVNWRREHRELPPNARIEDSTLTMTNVQLEDAGQYVCEASSTDGRVYSDYINLSVDCKYHK